MYDEGMRTWEKERHLAGLVDTPLLALRDRYVEFCTAETEAAALDAYAELVISFAGLLPFLSRSARELLEDGNWGRMWGIYDQDTPDSSLLNLFWHFDEMRLSARSRLWVDGLTISQLQEQAPTYIGESLADVFSWSAAASRSERA